MTQPADPANEPHWLKLAATLRVTPDPATMARVRARLASRPTEPAWVRWLARPAALAFSAGLLVVSAVAGSLWVSEGVRSNSTTQDTSMLSTLLGDDGSYGLPVSATDGAAGTTATDSGEVRP
jgi:anti-sigma factor RsiW